MNNVGKHRAADRGVLDSASTRSEIGAASARVELALPAPVGQAPMRPPLPRIDELRRRLQLAVEIDTTGWLRGIEIRFTLGPERTLHPTLVRVAGDVVVDELLLHGGPVGRCARYNRALGELRRLRLRLASLVRRGRTPLEPGSALWSAQQVLSKLEADVVSRQSARMGSNVVSLQVLEAETGFFESYHRYLATVVDRAETAAMAAMCDEDTSEVDPAD